MSELPDFLRLSDDDAERERSRQDRLRRQFNSRARLSSAEQDFARSSIIESSLRESLKATKDKDAKKDIRNQLGSAVASQGRFLEASRLTTDHQLKRFYEKAAAAVFDGKQCVCTGLLETVGNKQIRLPKYRVIMECYSLKLSMFGYLSECNRCKNWVFLGSNPLGPEISPNHFDPATTPNDLTRLKA